MPIILQLELKQTDDRWEQLGGAVSPAWSGKLLDDLDKEIRSVFSESQLITADDLRRPGLTLEQSILKYGWPTLDWARGKVMFFFDNGGPGAIRDMYLDGHPSLQGRAVFTRGNPGDAQHYARLCRGAESVLELGSGYGRLLTALAAPGRELWGLELDPGLLRLSRRALAALPPSLRRGGLYGHIRTHEHGHISRITRLGPIRVLARGISTGLRLGYTPLRSSFS